MNNNLTINISADTSYLPIIKVSSALVVGISLFILTAICIDSGSWSNFIASTVSGGYYLMEIPIGIGVTVFCVASVVEYLNKRKKCRLLTEHENKPPVANSFPHKPDTSAHKTVKKILSKDKNPRKEDLDPQFAPSNSFSENPAKGVHVFSNIHDESILRPPLNNKSETPLASSEHLEKDTKKSRAESHEKRPDISSNSPATTSEGNPKLQNIVDENIYSTIEIAGSFMENPEDIFVISKDNPDVTVINSSPQVESFEDSSEIRSDISVTTSDGDPKVQDTVNDEDNLEIKESSEKSPGNDSVIVKTDDQNIVDEKGAEIKLDSSFTLDFPNKSDFENNLHVSSQDGYTLADSSIPVDMPNHNEPHCESSVVANAELPIKSSNLNDQSLSIQNADNILTPDLLQQRDHLVELQGVADQFIQDLESALEAFTDIVRTVSNKKVFNEFQKKLNDIKPYLLNFKIPNFEFFLTSADYRAKLQSKMKTISDSIHAISLPDTTTPEIQQSYQEFLHTLDEAFQTINNLTFVNQQNDIEVFNNQLNRVQEKKNELAPAVNWGHIQTVAETLGEALKIIMREFPEQSKKIEDLIRLSQEIEVILQSRDLADEKFKFVKEQLACYRQTLIEMIKIWPLRDQSVFTQLNDNLVKTAKTIGELTKKDSSILSSRLDKFFEIHSAYRKVYQYFNFLMGDCAAINDAYVDNLIHPENFNIKLSTDAGNTRLHTLMNNTVKAAKTAQELVESLNNPSGHQTSYQLAQRGLDEIQEVIQQIDNEKRLDPYLKEVSDQIENHLQKLNHCSLSELPKVIERCQTNFGLILFLFLFSTLIDQANSIQEEIKKINANLAQKLKVLESSKMSDAKKEEARKDLRLQALNETLCTLQKAILSNTDNLPVDMELKKMITEIVNSSFQSMDGKSFLETPGVDSVAQLVGKIISKINNKINEYGKEFFISEIASKLSGLSEKNIDHLEKIIIETFVNHGSHIEDTALASFIKSVLTPIKNQFFSNDPILIDQISTRTAATISSQKEESRLRFFQKNLQTDASVWGLNSEFLGSFIDLTKLMFYLGVTDMWRSTFLKNMLSQAGWKEIGKKSNVKLAAQRWMNIAELKLGTIIASQVFHTGISLHPKLKNCAVPMLATFMKQAPDLLSRLLKKGFDLAIDVAIAYHPTRNEKMQKILKTSSFIANEKHSKLVKILAKPEVQTKTLSALSAIKIAINRREINPSAESKLTETIEIAGAGIKQATQQIKQTFEERKVEKTSLVGRFLPRR